MTIQRQPNQTGASRTAWIDVTAGVAGDMLLGALIDAGASLDVVQQAVDAVLPGAAKLTVQPVKRAGLRASKLDVAVRPAPARTWTTIRESLQTATLNDCVRAAALAVFARLAEAEGRVHGIPADDVHFHEVGAVDSIADVVGCCAAIDDLGITRIVSSPLTVGSGVVRSEHGELPIPVPAVVELTRGWPIFGGGDGELATPTGAAIVTTLAASCERIPEMRSDAVGLGAGQRDPARRANVVRIVVGEQSAEDGETSAVVLEANIDDLDPRVWPAVLAALLDAGAADAWLTPILMKKGRPAHTLHVLAAPEAAPRLRAVMVSETTTFGVRQTEVYKHALSRLWVPVELAGGTVRIKVAHRDGIVVRATPEFDDAQAVATAGGIPLNDVLAEVAAEAWRRGLRRGNRLPD